MKMNFPDRLKTILKSEGASIVGFADLKEIPQDNRDSFPVGISIGVAIDPKIISRINEGPTKSYVEECLRIDALLTKIAQVSEELLTSEGHKVKIQATTNTMGTQYPPNLTTALPHKTVATLAGLGWIGKCALLTTRDFGSAVRLGSILTDADLPIGIPIETSQCGDCTVCSDTCPGQALLGINWKTGARRDSLIDVITCRDMAKIKLKERAEMEFIGRTFCGICLASCPWTKKYIKRC